MNADGSLTVVAARVLDAAARGAGIDPAEAARVAAVPLYRARASLRELAAAGLLAEAGEAYRLTAAGAARVRTAEREQPMA